MRDEALYLQDIVDAADELNAFIGNRSKAEFVSSSLLTSAVLHKLLIIGEAASHISQETRRRHPEIEWADVVAFRNFAIHVYFSVDIERVWAAATLEAPILRDQVAQILSADYLSGDEEE
jgi:uncharacterized protein with HEPN domain